MTNAEILAAMAGREPMNMREIAGLLKRSQRFTRDHIGPLTRSGHVICGTQVRHLPAFGNQARKARVVVYSVKV